MTEREQRIFLERAARYARSADKEETREVYGRYAGIQIRETCVGIPLEHLVECAPLEGITSLKGLRHLIGVTQLRGEALGLFDLLQGLTGQESGECSRMAVLGFAEGRAAVAATDVLGLRVVYRDELLPAEQIPPTAGTTPVVTTKDLWLLCDTTGLRSVVDGQRSRSF